MALRNKVLFTNEFGQLGINGASYEAGKDITHKHLLGCTNTYLTFCNPLSSGTPTMRLQLHTGYAQGGGDVGASCCGIFIAGGKSAEAPVGLIGSCVDLNSPKSALNDPSPELLFQTGATHYNWRIAAEESVSNGFEIASSTTVNDNAYTSSYTDRLVIKGDTGNVGIGTASPSALAHLYSDSTGANTELRIEHNDASSTPTATMRFKRAGADFAYVGGAAAAISGASTTDLGLTVPSGKNIVFGTNNTERVRITSSGNVGIGTSSPNYILDSKKDTTSITHNLKTNVAAAANNCAEIAFQLWSGAGSGANDFGGAGTSRPSVVLRALSEDTSARGAFVIGTFSGGATNSTLTEKMRIASDGLTTITKDNSGVVYNNSLNPSLTLTNNNGTAGNFSTLSFNNGASHTALISAKHNRGGNNDADLLFSTRNSAGSASIDMRINSNSTTSKIIIGRDNEISGQQIGDALITVGYPTGTNIAGGNMFIRGGSSTGNAAGGYISFATSPAGSSGTTSNAEVERMRITSDGNVGIGVYPNSILARLHVAGDNDTEVIRVGGDGDAGGVQGSAYIGISHWKPTSVQTYSPIRIGAKEVTIADYRADLIFETREATSDSAPLERMRIRYNGNVGIGTSSPDYDLHVQDDVEANIKIETNNDGASNFAGLRMFKSRGTNALPTTVANGDTVAQVLMYARDGGDWNNTARMYAKICGTVTSTDTPTDLIFSTGTTGLNDRLFIKSDGTVCAAGKICSSTCIRANNCVIAPTVCGSTLMKGCVICGYRTGTGLANMLRLERCDAVAKTTCFLVSINPDNNCVVMYAACAGTAGILCSAQTLRAPVMYTNDCFCTAGCVYAAGVVYSPNCLCSPVVRATSNLIPSGITCCNANIKTYTWPSILCGPTSTACSYCYHLVRWSYDPFNWGNGGFMEFTLTEWYYSHRGGRKKYRIHSNGYYGGTGSAPQVVLVDHTNRGGSTEAFGIKVVGPTVVDGTAPGQEYFDVYLATRCYHAVQVQMETSAQCTTSNPPQNACIYICTSPTAQTDGTCFPICQIGSSSTECKCLGLAPFACGLEICGGTAQNLSRHDATLYVKASGGNDWGIFVDKPDGAFLQKWTNCSNSCAGLLFTSCDGATSRTEFSSCSNGITFSRVCFYSPIICGSSCVLAGSCVKSGIVCGGTAVCSPLFCGTGCLKSADCVIGLNVCMGNGWFRNGTSGTGLYNAANSLCFFSSSACEWTTKSNSTVAQIQFDGCIAGPTVITTGYVYGDACGCKIGFLNCAHSWSLMVCPNCHVYTPCTTCSNISCGITCSISPVICATTTMQVGGNDVLTTASSVGANFCTNTDVNNRVVTANGDAGSLCGEANLTFDGSTLNVTGAITASGDITSTSDERVKSNISEINGAIDIVSNLCGRIFIKDNKENVGVIAQEVEKILPQVVRNNPDGLKSVSYGNIVGVLIEAIKDQNKTIRDQNCRIENLEKIVQGR